MMEKQYSNNLAIPSLRQLSTIVQPKLPTCTSIRKLGKFVNAVNK